MIVTGALLAESASVTDNKLNITGGVLSACRVGPERAARATLVVLTQPEESDTEPKIKVTITDPAGGSVDGQMDVPPASLGGEIGFVFFPIDISLPTDGRYVISVTSDKGSVSLPLHVSS